MGEAWTSWVGDHRPGPGLVIDVIFSGDRREPHVWIMCRVTLAQIDDYVGTPEAWRPAEPFPFAVDAYHG